MLHARCVPPPATLRRSFATIMLLSPRIPQTLGVHLQPTPGLRTHVPRGIMTIFASGKHRIQQPPNRTSSVLHRVCSRCSRVRHCRSRGTQDCVRCVCSDRSCARSKQRGAVLVRAQKFRRPAAPLGTHHLLPDTDRGLLSKRRGATFWLRLKKLVGSYSVFSSTSLHDCFRTLPARRRSLHRRGNSGGSRRLNKVSVHLTECASADVLFPVGSVGPLGLDPNIVLCLPLSKRRIGVAH
jgi:hypothetical protein